MKPTTVLFDLDGTLLPMDQDAYTKAYCGSLARAVATHGYDPDLFIKTLWQGVGAMVKNDGTRTNEEAFWDVFRVAFGEKFLSDKPLFDTYYETGYPKLRPTCGFNPQAAPCIKTLKQQGFQLILATNPIFPRSATLQRMAWAGLDPSDFEAITAYESARHCKPNPDYYREIMEHFRLSPEECLMVGNDGEEDMFAAASAGIRGFLITGDLINRKHLDLSPFPQGDLSDLVAFLCN